MRKTLHVAPLALLLLLVTLGQAQDEDLNNSLQEVEGDQRKGKQDVSPTLMIADMARQLIGSSYSNSQVLSLNLSNVLILLLLKAVLFSIGHFGGFGGGGFGGGYGKGWGNGGGWWGRIDPDTQPRGLPEVPESPLSVTERELMMALGFLTSERETGADYGCMYRVACQDYNGRAPQYLTAGRMLLKAANVVSSVMTINPKYVVIVDGFEDAIKYGKNHGDCSSRYKCAAS